jgi:hypothetical protein
VENGHEENWTGLTGFKDRRLFDRRNMKRHEEGTKIKKNAGLESFSCASCFSCPNQLPSNPVNLVNPV